MFQSTVIRILAAALSFSAVGASAADAPSGQKIVTLIAPSSAGGALDVLARRIQPDFGVRTNSNVVIENITGASGAIGAQRLLNANTNTTSMLVGSTNELAITAFTLKGVQFKPEDFRMVGYLSVGMVAVYARPDFPANNLHELVDYLKRSNSKPVTYGSNGPGSIVHLIGVDISNRLKKEMSHVPYKGSGPAMQDLMGSQIDLTFLPLLPTYLQSAEAGKLKILGVLSPTRSAVRGSAQTADEVPALAGVHYNFWVGLFVSSKMPLAQASEINAAINDVVSTKAYKDWLTQLGISGGDRMSLDEAKAFYERDVQKVHTLVKTANITRE